MAGERSWILGLGLAITAAACGGATAPPASAPEAATGPAPAAATLTAADESTKAPSKEAASPAAATTREIPSACADKVACFPPSAFVDAACKRKFSDLPLYLFAGQMPWQHLYVKAEAGEPVNPYGGEQSETWMHFG